MVSANTWFTEVKYKKATENLTHYFDNVKLVNFDIIYSDFRKRKLEKPIEEYQTICNEDFDNYKPGTTR